VDAFDQNRNVEIDIEVREADAGPATQELVVLQLFGRGLAQSLNILDGKHQSALIAERDDEQTESWDVFDAERAWFMLQRFRPFQCGFDFGLGGHLYRQTFLRGISIGVWLSCTGGAR